MSTAEALQLQIDNLHHQIHQLQVENKKLRAEVWTDSEGDSPEVEQLQEEIEELWQLLHDHEPQEREVTSNGLLSESHDKIQWIKIRIWQNGGKMNDSQVSWAWYEQTF